MNRKLSEARLLAAKKLPYMTHAIMSLIPVERPGLGTMAVDEYSRMYFDPAFIESRELKHLGFVVLHETIHVWSRHGKRCERLLGKQPAHDRLAIWRYAVDAAVNDVLEQSGLQCPDEGVTPAKLGLPRNLTAEQYFNLLLEQASQEQEKQKQEQSKQGKSQDKPPESDGEQPSQDGNQEGEGKQESQGEGQGEPTAAEIGGSSMDGQPRPWEDGPPSEEHPGLQEHEQNLIEAATAKAIEDYQEQRGRGSVPGGIARQASDKLHPRIDPARELLAKVKYAVGSTSGFGAFTYQRPNRRQPSGGALLPAHIKPIPRVTVIIDTSGSMQQSDLQLALGVIANALRSLPDPRGLRVLAGDTAVASAKNVFRPESVELAGGGGTDMSAMIVAACEERPAPKAILVITDGYTGWPRKPVSPRVVVCLTRPNAASSVPEWIDTVILNPEE
ncbi:MAG: VWA-like domain-containing protein [Thermoguttaceae bacterium]|jgi:predicted metal-dependent peptidase